MKNSIIVLSCLTAGILVGHLLPENIVSLCTELPHWLLYLLILQVGLNLGANTDLSNVLHSLRPSDLLIPLFTIAGTLLFTAMASVLFDSWSARDCMAVGAFVGTHCTTQRGQYRHRHGVSTGSNSPPCQHDTRNACHYGGAALFSLRKTGSRIGCRHYIDGYLPPGHIALRR